MSSSLSWKSKICRHWKWWFINMEQTNLFHSIFFTNLLNYLKEVLTFVFWMIWWGLSLLGMTETPCWIWYLNNTWEKTAVRGRRAKTLQAFAAETHLCGAASVPFCDLSDDRVLQELVWISPTFEPLRDQQQIQCVKNQASTVIQSGLKYVLKEGSSKEFQK